VTRSYQAIDADSHILKPLDLWGKYRDPVFHDRRPRFVIDENGKERLSVRISHTMEMMATMAGGAMVFCGLN
jgi:hypothetical protein